MSERKPKHRIKIKIDAEIDTSAKWTLTYGEIECSWVVIVFQEKEQERVF